MGAFILRSKVLVLFCRSKCHCKQATEKSMGTYHLHEELGYRSLEFQRVDNKQVLRVFLLEAVGETRECGTERVKWDTLGDNKSDVNAKRGDIAGLAALYAISQEMYQNDDDDKGTYVEYI